MLVCLTVIWCVAFQFPRTSDISGCAHLFYCWIFYFQDKKSLGRFSKWLGLLLLNWMRKHSKKVEQASRLWKWNFFVFKNLGTVRIVSFGSFGGPKKRPLPKHFMLVCLTVIWCLAFQFPKTSDISGCAQLSYFNFNILIIRNK